jgi:YD repeat-containing protein
MEYDPDGRLLATRYRNPDGTQWVTRFNYDAAGRLLKMGSGTDGQRVTTTTYSYDTQGRMETIRDDTKPETPVVFHYDGLGRKTKIETSSPADYRANVARGGSPFEVLDCAPNVAGGGSATTIYDEADRPIEVLVQDAKGELLQRAVRTYDAQGHIVEERQILDRPENMIPAEARARMAQESGLSVDQITQDLRARLTQLMGGQSGPCSVTYLYDNNGRIKHTDRRVFDHHDEIETTYNEHGDMDREITRSETTADQADPSSTAGPPPYSEVRYSYTYDQHGNWVEKAISYRSGPEEAFQSSTCMKRTLTYY